MPIEVKHRASPGLHLQMAEYAGQGQYRKWLAEYKAKQEQAKTQAFLSAFGQGSKIGLAGRAQKHAAAMQTQRFGHEAGLQDTRTKAAIEAARLKRAHDLQMAKIRQTQSALGAAQTAQSNQALITGARQGGATPIRNYVNQQMETRLNKPYSLWNSGERAQAAQMVRNIYQGGTTQQGLSSVYGQQFNQAMQLGRQAGQRGGIGSAVGFGGVGGSQRQGALEAYRKQAGVEIGPRYSNQAQAGVAEIAKRVSKDEVIIPGQGMPGTPGYVAPIVGTAPGPADAYDETFRAYVHPTDAAQSIRQMRDNLAQQYRRERNGIAQERMKSSWQPTHREGTPVDKQWYKRVNPVTQEEEFELRDNVAPGVFAFQHNSAPRGNFDQMKEEDAGLNEMRAPYVESWKEFQSLLTLQGSMTREEWIAELKEGGYDKWYWGGEDDFIEMPENGWAKGAPFPGIPMEGMTPARGWNYDPHEHQVHWERDEAGHLTRSYRRMWSVAPTSYNTARNENDKRSLNRLHRRMQQQAMDSGGPTESRPASQAWKAYVDKYGHDPDEDLRRQFLNWKARKTVKEETEYLNARGVRREDVADFRQEPLAERDDRVLSEVMGLQQQGQLTPANWEKLGPEAKARYRRLFHLLDLRSGHADDQPEHMQNALRWSTYTENEWDEPDEPGLPHVPGTAGPGQVPEAPPRPFPEGTDPSLGSRFGPDAQKFSGQQGQTQTIGGKPYVVGTEGRLVPQEARGPVTREEVSTRLPSIAKGWGIRVKNRKGDSVLMYLKNPDPEALHLKTLPEDKVTDPNVYHPEAEEGSLRADPITAPAPPPSRATRLARPGQKQSEANRRAVEAQVDTNQRGLNEVRRWAYSEEATSEDRQRMVEIDEIWKRHAQSSNPVKSIERSKDRTRWFQLVQSMNRTYGRVLEKKPPATGSMPEQSDADIENRSTGGGF